MLNLKLTVHSERFWPSPIILVPKPDNTVDFCADYQSLNKVTVSEGYSMSRVKRDQHFSVIKRGKFGNSVGHRQIKIIPMGKEIHFVH